VSGLLHQKRTSGSGHLQKGVLFIDLFVVPRLTSELVVRLKFEHATTHMFDTNTTPRLYHWSLSIA
jgi:hypothetical protein